MTPTRLRRVPNVVEAVQIDDADYDGMCAIVAWCGGIAVDPDATEYMDGKHVIAIDTLEGRHYADPGDWIVRGIAGEFFPVKPHIFSQSYEPV